MKLFLRNYLLPSWQQLIFNLNLGGPCHVASNPLISHVTLCTGAVPKSIQMKRCTVGFIMSRKDNHATRKPHHYKCNAENLWMIMNRKDDNIFKIFHTWWIQQFSSLGMKWDLGQSKYRGLRDLSLRSEGEYKKRWNHLLVAMRPVPTASWDRFLLFVLWIILASMREREREECSLAREWNWWCPITNWYGPSPKRDKSVERKS